MKLRKWLLEVIDARDKALKEDAEDSVEKGIGETEGKLYRNQNFVNPNLTAIWKLDESSRRLEKLTIVLAGLTIILFIRTFFP